MQATAAASCANNKPNPAGADDVLTQSAVAPQPHVHSPGSSAVQALHEHELQPAASAAARPGWRRHRHRAPRLPYVLACMDVDDIAMQRITADMGAPSPAAHADLSQALQELQATAATRLDGLLGVVQEGGRCGDDMRRILEVTAMPMCETEVCQAADATRCCGKGICLLRKDNILLHLRRNQPLRALCVCVCLGGCH